MNNGLKGPENARLCGVGLLIYHIRCLLLEYGTSVTQGASRYDRFSWHEGAVVERDIKTRVSQLIMSFWWARSYHTMNNYIRNLNICFICISNECNVSIMQSYLHTWWQKYMFFGVCKKCILPQNFLLWRPIAICPGPGHPLALLSRY